MARKSQDDALLARARERFSRAVDYEAENRKRWREHWRFVAMSEQWDDADLAARKTDRRPALTVNKLAGHVRQVVNDVRQNRPSIKVLPIDDIADPETAEILTGLCRHIYYSSDGESATDTAAEHAVAAGWGYFRVQTKIIDKESGEQDILIKRVVNPLMIYMDPEPEDQTAAGAQWAFVVTKMPAEEAKKKGIRSDSWHAEEGYDKWVDGDDILVAEYFEVEDGSVKWYKLTASKVLERTDWLGDEIPLIRVVGNESHIDGKAEYWGMVRDAMGPQRLYNLWATAEAEIVSLMPKAPYLMPAGAEEGFEKEWADANTTNRPYIRFNSVDSAGNPVSTPQRAQPPIPPSGIIQAKIGAADDIKSVTGQFDASLGARSNETSGKAIMARQREGDVSTYHYPDNVSRSVRQLGRILVNLIPKVYDTKRIARIMGEDTTVDSIQIDPEAPTPSRKIADAAGKISRVFNPGLGRYDVTVASGPSFTTRRQEGAEMMTEAMKTNPALSQLIGDLYFRILDVPYADDIARRMKAMLPPQIAAIEQEGADDIPPQARAQIQQLQAGIQELQQQLQMAAQSAGQFEQQAKAKEGDVQVRMGELAIKSKELDIKEREVALKEQELAVRVAEIEGDQAIEEAKIKADAELKLAQIMRNGGAEAGGETENETEGSSERTGDGMMGGAAFAMMMATQMQSLKDAMAEIAARMESGMRAVQTVSIKPVRGADGRLVGGVQVKADGTEVPVMLQ